MSAAPCLIVSYLLLHQPFCCSSYGYHGRRVVVYNSNTSMSDVLRDEPEIHKVHVPLDIISINNPMVPASAEYRIGKTKSEYIDIK